MVDLHWRAMETQEKPQSFPGDELQAAYEARDTDAAKALLQGILRERGQTAIPCLLQEGDGAYLAWLLDCGLAPYLEECHLASLLGKGATPPLVCSLLEHGASPYRDAAKEELWPGIQELLLQCDTLPEGQRTRCILREEWGYKDVP